jgi:hypothetical protein
MSKRRFFTTLTTILVVGGLFFLLRKKAALQPTAILGDQTEAPVATTSSPVVPPLPSSPVSSSGDRLAPSAKQENMQKLANVLFEFSRPSQSFSHLIQYLRDSGQEPFVARDKNESTGELMIVRTKSPFPGTRYFHAQYFSDNGQDRFMQHMSFEIPSGPMAMSEAVQAVKKSFPGLNQPKVQSSDFTAWDAGDGFTVWVKRLNAEELKDNPFNAYTKDDAGTVRIAIEATPEGD